MQETLEAYKLSICLVWGSQSIKRGGVVVVVVGKRRGGHNQQLHSNSVISLHLISIPLEQIPLLQTTLNRGEYMNMCFCEREKKTIYTNEFI